MARRYSPPVVCFLCKKRHFSMVRIAGLWRCDECLSAGREPLIPGPRMLAPGESIEWMDQLMQCLRCEGMTLELVTVKTPGTAVNEYALDCAACGYYFQPLQAGDRAQTRARYAKHVARVQAVAGE